MRSPALALVSLLALSGCYATNGRDDSGPVDAFRHDAPGLDAAGVDARSTVSLDTDPFVFPDGGAPGDVGFCLCASDADCPPPPPSWNCLSPFCSDCTCTYRLVPELCGPEGVCQPTGECLPRDLPDTGMPIDRDAALLRRDGGPFTPDTGLHGPDPDAGVFDAGFVRPDAFFVPRDAFVVPVDAFVAPIDAFVPPGRDAGRPPSSDALRFTSAQAMTVPDRPALSVGPDLTLELWARLRSPGVIAIKGDPSIGSHLYLELRPSADGTFRTFWLGWSEGGTRVIVEVDRPIAFDTWTHFALVQQGASTGRLNMELFVDGESASGVIDAGDTSSYLASFTSSAFVIGRTEMDVDEVRLWRVARRRAAIQGFMRTELTPGVSGLLAYWPLDGVGQVVLDRSLNGNDGFRGNSPAEDGADPTWIADGAF
ncbi:MAG: LamG domain-containing protein [Deltaproteobacteria bacterium]|nr:LamG domain-containing protein [Deltaproteobacteria bacterium]